MSEAAVNSREKIVLEMVRIILSILDGFDSVSADQIMGALGYVRRAP